MSTNLTLLVLPVMFFAVLQLSVVPSVAKVASVVKGKDETTVTVEGKTADSTVFIWVENTDKAADPPRESDYEQATTGIDVGNDGKGKKTFKNSAVSGELKKGRKARTGGRGAGAGGGGVNLSNPAATVAQNVPVTGPVVVGLNVIPDLTLTQSVTDGILTMLETWDPGTLYAVSLLPNEASWVDLGISLLTEGDLKIELVEVTSERVLLRVLEDHTLTTSDDAHIFGLGLNVFPDVTSVGVQLAWLGSNSVFLDGVFSETFTSAVFDSHEWFRVQVVPEPSTVLLFGTGLAVLLGSAWRRRQNANNRETDHSCSA